MKKDAKEAVELTRYIHQFLDEYAPSHLTGSRHTLKSYRTALSLYMFFLEKVMGITIATLKFSCFSRENIEKWVEWLDGERNCSAATVNIRLSSLRTFLKYLGERDVACLYLYQEVAMMPRKKNSTEESGRLVKGSCEGPAGRARHINPDRASGYHFHGIIVFNCRPAG